MGERTSSSESLSPEQAAVKNLGDLLLTYRGEGGEAVHYTLGIDPADFMNSIARSPLGALIPPQESNLLSPVLQATPLTFGETVPYEVGINASGTDIDEEGQQHNQGAPLSASTEWMRHIQLLVLLRRPDSPISCAQFVIDAVAYDENPDIYLGSHTLGPNMANNVGDEKRKASPDEAHYFSDLLTELFDARTSDGYSF